MRKLTYVILTAFFFGLNGCGVRVKTIWLTRQDVIENKYISFGQPASGWYLLEDKQWSVESGGTTQWIRLYSNRKGATYQIEVDTWPFRFKPYEGYFNNAAKYKLVLRDENMNLDENDKEQGIDYFRQWVSYVQGMKCTEGVFSRSRGGIMKDMHSKNYSLTCGYYDKAEGKRLLHISYYYSYAGGSLRLQKDADLPQGELISLEDVELRLKQAVKQLVGAIRIKNMDRKRMGREGLLHYDKAYEISPY